MKIKIESLIEFNNILKGVVKLVPGCCIEVNNDGAEFKIGGNGKCRAFIKTTSIHTTSKDDYIELCFESVSKLIQAIMFLTDMGSANTLELETDGVFLKYTGKGKFKLSLDKKERIEQFTTLPLKTEFDDLFSFRITQDQINMIMKYSTFNPNFIVNGYFYVKDKMLFVDIDNKQESKLSSVSIPLTDKFTGELSEPIVIDLNDIKNFSLIDKEKIKINICKQCLRVLSFRKSETTKTSLQMIVRLLKG